MEGQEMLLGMVGGKGRVGKSADLGEKVHL